MMLHVLWHDQLRCMFVICLKLFSYTGDTGHGVEMWTEHTLDKTMDFPHLKVLYPTAPKRYGNFIILIYMITCYSY